MSALERIELMASNPTAYAQLALAEAQKLDARVKANHDRSCDIWEEWTERHRIERQMTTVHFKGCRRCGVKIQKAELFGSTDGKLY